MADISTKPYLIRAIHEWCEDSGFRPYIAVMVDEHTIVPREFVRNGEIVLNVSAQATNHLRIGNELVEFEARFSGAVRQVSVPIANVSAIYAQETGHGMAFDVPKPLALAPEPASTATPAPSAKPARPKLVPDVKPKPKPGAARDPDASEQASPDRTEAHTPAADTPLRPVTSASDQQGSPAAAARKPAARGRRRSSLAAVDAPGSSENSPEGSAGSTPAGAVKAEPPSVAGDAAGSAATPLPRPSEVPAPRADAAESSSPDEPPPPSPAGGRPHLKRVK